MEVEWCARDKRAHPAGRPTHKLAGAVPRNGSYDRYYRWVRMVQWLMGQVVTGARTSALRECRAPWSSHKAPPPPPRGRPSQGTAGSQPKDWQALFF